MTRTTRHHQTHRPSRTSLALALLCAASLASSQTLAEPPAPTEEAPAQAEQDDSAKPGAPAAVEPSSPASPEAKPKPEPEKDAPICVATGKPNYGWLVNGHRLQASERLRVRTRTNYGTPETIEGIEDAVEAVHRRFPKGTHALVVGDLSKKGGGPLPPHKSHQNGCDADLGYFHKGAHAPKHFWKATKDNFDIPRSWALIKAMVATGQVQYIFVDYKLQKWLYDYAKNDAPEGLKTSAKTLDRWFAYPRGRRARAGIIRHSRGHLNHLHVRFKCPKARAAVKAYVAKHGPDALKPFPKYYKVKKGDFLGKIARKFKVSVKELLKWNKLKRKAVLKPGKKLIIGWTRPGVRE